MTIAMSGERTTPPPLSIAPRRCGVPQRPYRARGALLLPLPPMAMGSLPQPGPAISYVAGSLET